MAACALVVVGIVGVGVAKSSTIAKALSDQWRSLSHPGIAFAGREANAASGRLSSPDPLERYDYWRVSLNGLRSNPIGGLGAGGFEHRYTLDRRYSKTSRYPHNLVMKVAGDTGVVGFALMGGLLALFAAGLLRPGRLSPRGRMVSAAAAAMLAYFLAHGLFDWLEAYPVLVGPALGFPLVALAARGRAERRAQPGAGEAPAARAGARARSRAVFVAAGLGAVLACGALLAPWLALRYRDRAADTWRTAPAAAYRDLDRAAGLDPLSPKPLVLQGVIGLARGDIGVARTGFERALEREQAWLPHFGLAAIAAAAGDRARAAGELAQARRLNPNDPVLPEVAKRLLSDERVDPATAVRDVLTSPLFSRESVS